MRLFYCCCTVIFCLCAWSCGGSGSSSNTVSEAQQTEFVYYNGPEPRTIDPGLLTDSYGAFLALNLFEGLTVWDAAAKTLLPGVAKSWSVSDDQLTYTFHLRQDARWSDGSPVTASHFVKAWNRVLNPDTQAGFATLLYPIRGARQLHQGATTDASTFGAKAIDNYTLVVELDAPIPYFLSLTADAVMLPINPDCLKKHGWAWTDPENIVVNGPYKLDDWQIGKWVDLKKNPRYWDTNNVQLGRVRALTAPPGEGILESYKSGGLHWTGPATQAVNADEWVKVGSDPGYRSFESLTTGYLVINTEAPPFDQLDIRQALAHAVDREAAAAPGQRVAIDHLVPKGLGGYTPAQGLQTDYELARKLLADAGYPGGKGFPPVEIASDTQDANVKAMEAVAKTWRDELGIEVNVYVREWRIHSSAMHEGNFQVARFAWAADYPDPSNFMEIFLGSSPLNPAHHRDSVFDDFFNEAQLTIDPASHNRLLNSAEKRLLELAPIVPLYQDTSRSLLSPAIKGFEDNVLNMHLLKHLSF